MATRTPSLQTRSRVHRDWGNFTDPTNGVAGPGDLPNQGSNVLAAAQFTLEEGDIAYVDDSVSSAFQGRYHCVDPGTAGGGDAVWEATGGGSATGTLLFSGATNEEVTDPSGTTYVVGGIVFDPTQYANAPTFRFFGVLAGTAPTNAELTLVDLGAPGSPIAGVVRSTATIPGATINQPVVVDVGLTVDPAPGVNADEIFDEERMYELRLALNGAAGDTAIVRWGGLVIS